MRSAIIDIGSNAIRAAVYESSHVGAPEIFSHKFKSDILSLLEQSNFDAEHKTHLAIQYLSHVFGRLNVTDIQCVATAILRDHPKAVCFVHFIKNKYNFDIKIISGKEEARLTAIGLISGIAHSDGIAIDLGGGSLELIEVSNAKIGKLESFNLGTKVIYNKNLLTQQDITNIIKSRYGNFNYSNLYLIGGALRVIGKLYIDFVNHPIKSLHNLEITTKEFLDYLSFIESYSTTGSRSQLLLHRNNINNFAVLVAKSVIEVFKPKNIIISTYGLKEGVRLESINNNSRKKKQNLLIEKVKYACDYYNEKTDFSSYAELISQLILSQEKISEIMQLSIMLLKLKHKFDSTLYPRAISEFIINSEIPFTHKNRIQLSLILTCSTHFRPNQELILISKKVLSKQAYNDCQIIGKFLYISELIDGPVFTVPSFSIQLQYEGLRIVNKTILPKSVLKKIYRSLELINYLRNLSSN